MNQMKLETVRRSMWRHFAEVETENYMITSRAANFCQKAARVPVYILDGYPSKN